MVVICIEAFKITENGFENKIYVFGDYHVKEDKEETSIYLCLVKVLLLDGQGKLVV